jgi:DNA-binding transcriptional regulator YhcF (GntR family)
VIIAVDISSGVPPYEQIRDQVSRMIASGVLSPGARLPTIQQLANDLQLAPGTVARGYKELERDGLVVSRRRRGTSVAEHPERAPAREIRAEVDAAIERFVLQVRQLGAEPSEALDRAHVLLDSGRIAS